MSVDPKAEVEDILHYYDLGTLVACERNERGYVNTSYAVDLLRGGQRQRYFLRRYKADIRPTEIEFEHSIIQRLVEAGEPPVARLHRTRDGQTYLCCQDAKGEQAYCAVFDYLPDEDRYTWVGPRCTPEEIRNAAVVQAQFHRALTGFKPRGRRKESRILGLLAEVSDYLAATPQRSKGTAFDEYLVDNLAFLLGDLRATQAVLREPAARRLPQTVIHCDFHPGNLKFRGAEVTGVFDFDWSKVDLRAFDVALALWYFFVTWDAPQDGELRLSDAGLYLDSYQAALRQRPGLAPLSPDEGTYLPHLLNAASYYVLNWTVLDYYRKDVHPGEYLAYLQHSVRFSQWFRAPGNLEAIQAIVAPRTTG